MLHGPNDPLAVHFYVGSTRGGGRQCEGDGCDEQQQANQADVRHKRTLVWDGSFARSQKNDLLPAMAAW